MVADTVGVDKEPSLAAIFSLLRARTVDFWSAFPCRVWFEPSPKVLNIPYILCARQSRADVDVVQ